MLCVFLQSQQKWIKWAIYKQRLNLHIVQSLSCCSTIPEKNWLHCYLAQNKDCDFYIRGVWDQFLLWVSLAPGAKFSPDLILIRTSFMGTQPPVLIKKGEKIWSSKKFAKTLFWKYDFILDKQLSPGNVWYLKIFLCKSRKIFAQYLLPIARITHNSYGSIVLVLVKQG